MNTDATGTQVASHRSRLPAQPTPFIGRAAEIDALFALLCRPDVRLVTLTGPGGSGKTRIAIEVAARMGDAFACGVRFVSLAPVVDPELVGAAIAAALEAPPESGQAPLEAVVATLGGQRLLLVLDNFEQVLPAAPLIADLLDACPDLHILVTSRGSLRLRGEVEFAVPPFELPALGQQVTPDDLAGNPAVELFVQRAKAAQPAFDLTGDGVAAVAELCVRLDGLPLAIELAASRAKLLSPRQMLARLTPDVGRLDLLADGPREAPVRQQTVRDTVAWSYTTCWRNLLGHSFAGWPSSRVVARSRRPRRSGPRAGQHEPRSSLISLRWSISA